MPEQLPLDDWADQDLPTRPSVGARARAEQRLAEAVRELESELAAGGAEPVAGSARERRLRAMRQRLEQLRGH
jgi:hypothetical protein